MIPGELLPFFDSCPLISVGTSGRSLSPDAMQAVCCEVAADRRSVKVFLPVATARTALENLKENPRAAVALSNPPSHRAIQLKGLVQGVTRAEPAQQPVVERYMRQLTEQLKDIGFTGPLVAHVTRWPCWVIDLRVDELFIQTPGPLAGTRLDAT